MSENPDSSARSAEYIAPDVPRPLNVSNHMTDPCELVPVDVLRELGYDDEGEELVGDESKVAEVSGPGCGWLKPDSEASSLVHLNTGARDNGRGGLKGMYSAYQDGWFEYWEPAEVAGYPAAYSARSDQRAEGHCGVIVGIADDLTFSVDSGPYREAPARGCEVATKIAGSVIETLSKEEE